MLEVRAAMLALRAASRVQGDNTKSVCAKVVCGG